MCYDTFGDCQSWTPLISKNIQAYATVGIDVWMIDAGCEVHFGRLKRVVGREVDGEEEDTAGVWTVTLQILVRPSYQDRTESQ